jgi:hypothetical protein
MQFEILLSVHYLITEPHNIILQGYFNKVILNYLIFR